MEHISKAFGGAKALEDAFFELRPGEIHALMGANGAGKSTLMKVLAGVHTPDTGKIVRNGKELKLIAKVAEAQKNGIAMVFQELNILPHLNVLENIFIANEITRGGHYNWKAMRRRASELMADTGIQLDLNARAGDLSVATQQMIEIMRALNLETEILIFDEPTSSLSMTETDQLFKLMCRLKERGIGMVYISHRMSEIYRICDRITLLRDGKNVFTDDICHVDNHRLLAGIVGSENTNQFPEKNCALGEVIFQAENVSCGKMYQDISFNVREGEIVGFAGLAGAGRTELAKTIFGYYHLTGGKFSYRGKNFRARTPLKAIHAGIGYVSEDRKVEGILAVRPIKENMAISDLHNLTKNGRINNKMEREMVQALIEELRIKTTGMYQTIENLSGGNQQKVCLGKWIMMNPQLLLLDEPTRGVDVGARAEFYKIIHQLAQKKIGIVIISSEEDELIGLCNRIVVMREGRKVGELPENEVCLKEKMLKLMLDI